MIGFAAPEVRVTVIDKLARKQYEVEPRQFDGRLLHQLPAVRTSFGDAYAELYLAEPARVLACCAVPLRHACDRGCSALFQGSNMRPGPRAISQGLIDVPFLNLTPGTRSGIIHDERYAALCEALGPLEAHLNGLIEEQQRAEEEQASQQSLRAIQRAFREALLALPPEEYDWFDVQRALRQAGRGASSGENGKALGALPEESSAGRGRTGARGRATAPVLRSTQDRSSVSSSRPPRARLPVNELPRFRSAAARSVPPASDRRPALPLGNHRRRGLAREWQIRSRVFRHRRHLDSCDCAPP